MRGFDRGEWEMGECWTVRCLNKLNVKIDKEFVI